MGRILKHIIPLLLLFYGCGPQRGAKENAATFPSDSTQNEQFAGKFSIHQLGDLTLLNVYTPWQNAAGARFSYLLGNHPADVPDSLSDIPFIKTPVEKTVIMSTTFIGFLDTLGVTKTIRGVSGGDYIYNEQLLRRYRAGEIREVGYDQQLNYELLLQLDPDVVFLFGVQSGIVQTVNKLQETGIPVVICADYLEPHPLGRAEWIKFFAAFYEKQELAADIFGEVAHRYDSLASSIANRARKGEVSGKPGKAPKVMLGLPWKDTWYVAGGGSFAARLISDAGGAYLFSNHDHAEAKPYDIETVFSRAMEADVWLNPGIAASMEEILEHDPRFGKLDVFGNGAVYNNNRRMGAGGGNDYWESGVIRPDLILHDLVRIFHGTAPDISSHTSSHSSSHPSPHTSPETITSTSADKTHHTTPETSFDTYPHNSSNTSPHTSSDLSPDSGRLYYYRKLN